MTWKEYEQIQIVLNAAQAAGTLGIAEAHDAQTGQPCCALGHLRTAGLDHLIPVGRRYALTVINDCAMDAHRARACLAYLRMFVDA